MVLRRRGPGSIVDGIFPGKTARELDRNERLILQREYYSRTREIHAKTMKRCREKLLNLFFSRYGSVCVCCTESNKTFLTIEHLHGGGRKHRKELPGGIERIIRDIRNRGWPEGYATLCMNCNFGKWRNGGTCPHVVEKTHEWLREICEIQKEIDATPPCI